MKTIPVISRFLFAGALAIAVLAPAAPSAAEATDSGSTLENMQAAFNGESNAHARYLAFAAKADEEGYGQVASLFRAAAMAEEIHAKNHADVIEKLGATAAAVLETPEVGTTAANLQAAIAGESYERDSMYPAFLKQARADGNRAAVRSLNFAMAAEGEHAALYKSALDNLDAWKDGKKTFYVCPECGKTVTTRDFQECSVCYTEAEEFVEIS